MDRTEMHPPSRSPEHGIAAGLDAQPRASYSALKDFPLRAMRKAHPEAQSYVFRSITEHDEMSSARRAASMVSRIELFSKFQHHGAFMFSVPVLQSGDTSEEPLRSRLVMFEDGVPLRRAHEQHSTISGTGRGSYSHWERTIFFSTSDNSDPNINGRSYSYEINKDHREAHDEDGTTVLHAPFERQSGLCWGTAVAEMGEDNLDMIDLGLQLFEDGLPLGPSRAPHSEIAELGRGAYSHWKSYLYFSTSDDTDPNLNGRIYSYSIMD